MTNDLEIEREKGEGIDAWLAAAINWTANPRPNPPKQLFANEIALVAALGKRTVRDHPAMTNDLEIEREKGEGFDAWLAAAINWTANPRPNPPTQLLVV